MNLIVHLHSADLTILLEAEYFIMGDKIFTTRGVESHKVPV